MLASSKLENLDTRALGLMFDDYSRLLDITRLPTKESLKNPANIPWTLKEKIALRFANL